MPRSNRRSDDDEVETPRRSRKRPFPLAVLLLIVGIPVGLTLVGGAVGLFLLFRGSPAAVLPNDRERDEDYLAILDLKFEDQAVLALTESWLKARGGWLDEFGAASDRAAVADYGEAQHQALEKQIATNRQVFISRHGVDDQAYKAEFLKRYPERNVLFDEISAATRDIGQRQKLAVLTHLNAKSDQIGKELSAEADRDPRVNAEYARRGFAMVDERMRVYRTKYLTDQAPAFFKEARDAVNKMDSVKRLREKVRGR